jgi:hypothetical protein
MKNKQITISMIINIINSSFRNKKIYNEREEILIKILHQFH